MLLKMIAILQRITGCWGRGRGGEGRGGADCLQNTGSKDISGDRIIRAGAGRKEKAGVKLELKRGQ